MAVKNHENSVNLQQVEGDAGFSKYVKGVPISNKSYTKEVHFLTKLLYKLGTGLDLGAKLPLYKTLLSTPARVWAISKKQGGCQWNQGK